MRDNLIDYAISIIDYVVTSREDTKKKKKSNMRVFSSRSILASALVFTVLSHQPLLSLPFISKYTPFFR